MIRAAQVGAAALLGSLAFLGFYLDTFQPVLGQAPGLVALCCLGGAVYFLRRLGFD